MMIEHVDAVIDLRRYQTLEQGATPGKAAEVLEELQATDTISGRPLQKRLDWAADLRLPLLDPDRHCEVLLWVGEGGFDLRNQRTLRALVKLLRAAGVEFGVLGEAELDCGHLARRLGDEAGFEDLACRNIATLDGYRFDRIVTVDPHVLHTIGNEYPAYGGDYVVEHHTTLLARLLRQGRLPELKPGAAPLTYHDPCYLGRYNGEYDAPRELLRALGGELHEMDRSGPRSMCCGWGGGAGYTDVPGERRIPDLRMEQVRDTGAGTVAVACPNCAVMLEGVVQPRAGVSDIAELLADAAGLAP
jgi:Fe-S oxidoreductase